MKFQGKIFAYCFTKSEFFGTLIKEKMYLQKYRVAGTGYNEVKGKWYVRIVVHT